MLYYTADPDIDATQPLSSSLYQIVCTRCKRHPLRLSVICNYYLPITVLQKKPRIQKARMQACGVGYQVVWYRTLYEILYAVSVLVLGSSETLIA